MTERALSGGDHTAEFVDIAPIEIPVSSQDAAVATDPITFVDHVLTVTADLIPASYPRHRRHLPDRRVTPTRM